LVYFLAAFDYEADDENNKVFFGRHELINEFSIMGEVYSWAHSAQLQAEQFKGDLFRLVLNTQEGVGRALYLPDHDADLHGNVFESSKEPFMAKGAAPDDPAFDPTNPGLSITNGKYFVINGLDLEYSPTDEIFIFSVYLKIRIFALPSSSETEPLLTLKSDKQIQLRLKDTGFLELYGSATESYDYTQTALVADGNWNHIVVTIGKLEISPSNFEDYWMVEVQGHPSGSEGSAITCKVIADFRDEFGFRCRRGCQSMAICGRGRGFGDQDDELSIGDDDG
jgi:hypothetical protein